jgi:hypothetical protein
MEEMWHSKLHLKVKNFVWMVDRNTIRMVDNLGKKNRKGSMFCQMCNEGESVDQLMFRARLQSLCGL